MAEDKFMINSAVANQIMQPKQNYGHAIADMFKDLGTIANQQEEKNDKEMDRQIKELSVQQIKDQVEDNSVLADYMRSDYADINTWLKDTGKKIRTPEVMSILKAESDKKTQEMWDNSLGNHINYLKENNLFFNESGEINMPEVRKQLARDPQNFHLAQAFERAYGTKLEKPAEELTMKDLLTDDIKEQEYEKKTGIKIQKPTDIKAQLQLQKMIMDMQKDANDRSDTQIAIQDVNDKYKTATGGRSMTAEQIQAFKKKGDVPYYEYGTQKNLKKEEQVTLTLDLKETVDFLNELSDEDLQRVIGFWSESWGGTLAKRATGQYSERDREIIQKIGKLNAEEMHRLYGAALTGGEVDRAKTWNLDRDFTSDVKTFKSNLKNFKQMADKAYKRNTYGVYIDPKVGYGALQEENNKEENKALTADQAMSLGIKFN